MLDIWNLRVAHGEESPDFTKQRCQGNLTGREVQDRATENKKPTVHSTEIPKLKKQITNKKTISNV